MYKIRLATTYLILITTSLASVPLFAESEPPPPPADVMPQPPTDATFWERRGQELASPWTTPARPWLVAGTALTVGLVLARDKISDPWSEDLHRHEPLGDWAVVGDYFGRGVPQTLYILTTGLDWYLHDDLEAADDALVMAKATWYAVILTTIIKPIADEKRPNFKPSDSQLSFPSGHTASAFAFSSAVTGQHGFWPWGFGATALATLCGFSRMNDHKHFFHDVIGGATLGISYGLGISYLHKEKSWTKVSPRQHVETTFMPFYSYDAAGLVAEVLF